MFSFEWQKTLPCLALNATTATSLRERETELTSFLLVFKYCLAIVCLEIEVLKYMRGKC